MSKRRKGWTGITVTDQFCGAGGSTIGAKRAGVEVRQAMNHWPRAVETYNANHPDTHVHCADVSAQDPRRFLSTDMLITSPECTTHSPAGGNRKTVPQRDLFMPHVDDPAMVRSRATMWDVPRFAEYHEYNVIIAENVVEVTRWPLFETWLQAMRVLGYEHKIVSLNSMFCHPTPQSRDRVYMVFWKKGNRAPDLEIRPKAPCFKCERIVEARQTWKNGRTVGKYRFQYVYTCPTCSAVVNPYYYAALNAIDFSLPAERIGDRERPLRERTLERIRYGLQKYGNRHLLVRTIDGERLAPRVRSVEEAFGTQPASNITGLFTVNISRATDASKVRSVVAPMASQTTQQEVALVSPAFIAVLRTNSKASPLDAPLHTLCTGGGHHLVVQGAAQISLRDADAMRVAGLDRELMAQGCAPQQALIQGSPFLVTVAYDEQAKGAQARGLDQPIPSVTGNDRDALLQPRGKKLKVEDCYFRMLQPHEIGAAMAFPSDYTVTGNKRDRVKQYGNAVTPPAMDELVTRVVASLAPEVRQ